MLECILIFLLMLQDLVPCSPIMVFVTLTLIELINVFFYCHVLKQVHDLNIKDSS
jgi:hypothetical protein